MFFKILKIRVFAKDHFLFNFWKLSTFRQWLAKPLWGSLLCHCIVSLAKKYFSIFLRHEFLSSWFYKTFKFYNFFLSLSFFLVLFKMFDYFLNLSWNGVLESPPSFDNNLLSFSIFFFLNLFLIFLKIIIMFQAHGSVWARETNYWLKWGYWRVSGGNETVLKILLLPILAWFC